MNSPKKITMADVEEKTREFLNLHWNGNAQQLAHLPDSWGVYSFIGNVPSGDQQGCYALIKHNEVIYIGLGVSRGYGIYEGNGISARLNKHVLRWDRKTPTNPANRKYEFRAYWKEKGVTEVYTFGFPPNYGYLAPALEAFLISRLEPVENSTKTASLSNKIIQPTS